MAPTDGDLGALTSRVSTAMIVLTVLAVSLRFVARKMSGATYGYDDWFALASLPFTLGISVSFYLAVVHGYGTPSADVRYYYRIIYVDELLWYTSFLFTKLSILFFYNRIFNTRSRRPIMLYAIGVFTIIWWIVIFFMSIFQCKPVTGSIAVRGSKCFPPLPFFYAQTIPNLITDFAILVFPVPTIWTLQMRLTKKLGLIMVFLVGYFVPIISIVRVIYFVKLAEQQAAHSSCLYSFLLRCRSLSTIWSILEPAFALVGACIPTLTIIARWSYELASRRFRPLRSKASGGRGSPRFQASNEFPRGVRGIFTKVDSQDTVEKNTSSGNSIELLKIKASNISSKSMPERSIGPVQIYNSEPDSKAGSLANQLAMSPHRINA